MTNHPSLASGFTLFRKGAPSSTLSDAELLAHVLVCEEARSKNEPVPIEWQAERVFEVCLALACVRKEPEATSVLQSKYGHEFERALRRYPKLAPAQDDIRQRFWENLCAKENPALLTYSGRGPLGAWLSAAAVRLMLNVLSREQRETPTESSFFDAVVATEPDAERAYQKLASRAALQSAFEAAVAWLDPEERTLLKLAILDRLTVDEIASLFQVHRATAARWVASARERLVRRTHAELMGHLHVNDADAASIVRAGLSGIGFTFLGAQGSSREGEV